MAMQVNALAKYFYLELKKSYRFLVQWIATTRWLPINMNVVLSMLAYLVQMPQVKKKSTQTEYGQNVESTVLENAPHPCPHHLHPLTAQALHPPTAQVVEWRILRQTDSVCYFSLHQLCCVHMHDLYIPHISCALILYIDTTVYVEILAVTLIWRFGEF